VQSLLSVSGDGSICIVPLNALAQLGGECSFKAASSWSGYSQGRWIDSQTFATVSEAGSHSVLGCAVFMLYYMADCAMQQELLCPACQI
jgi:hypothetical protein